jgi:hypothetical protein
MPVRKIVISNTDGVYECFPCLTLTQSGKLITVYRESDSHTASQYSHLVMRHSTDQGETWSERQVLIESRQRDGVLHKWNCPRIGQLDDGRLWVLCDGYNVPPGEGRTVDSRIHFWWCEDDGATWSEPRETPIFGIVPDKLLVTREGTWLVAAQIGETRHTFLVQFVFRSDDEGASWQPIVVCDQEGLNPCEASIVQLPDDGTLVCYMRENSGRGWPGPKCLSHDDGRTWEGPYMTDMIGCHRPVAGLLPSGNIMVTHRHTCRGRIGSARNFFAFRESADSARQTDPALGGGIILPLDHDRWDAPDQGYSGWVVLPNDRIVVVNYIRDDGPMAHIRGYFLTEQDF